MGVNRIKEHFECNEPGCVECMTKDSIYLVFTPEQILNKINKALEEGRTELN